MKWKIEKVLNGYTVETYLDGGGYEGCRVAVSPEDLGSLIASLAVIDRAERGGPEDDPE